MQLINYRELRIIVYQQLNSRWTQQSLSSMDPPQFSFPIIRKCCRGWRRSWLIQFTRAQLKTDQRRQIEQDNRQREAEVPSFLMMMIHWLFVVLDTQDMCSKIGKLKAMLHFNFKIGDYVAHYILKVLWRLRVRLGGQLCLKYSKLMKTMDMEDWVDIIF